jgi:hypothetical protein
LALVLLIALMVLYRYGPSRSPPGWRWLSVGAVVAIALWLVGSSLLSWYLSNFASYTATYGSLGAAIGLMMWMWMSAIIILVGAELNSEIQRQGRASSDQGPPAIAKTGQGTVDVPGCSCDASSDPHSTCQRSFFAPAVNISKIGCCGWELLCPLCWGDSPCPMHKPLLCCVPSWTGYAVTSRCSTRAREPESLQSSQPRNKVVLRSKI